ncbi:MAG: hypothetical protein CML68_03600 [Rhodobacteraceae bacterium]|nr:hypothetical protein [Paracoccaceae bacterium]
MTLREALLEDVPEMQRFLRARAETSMFLLSNLDAHGIGEIVHPHGSVFWLHHGAGGIDAVLGASNSGFLMVQAPDLPPAVWAEWAAVLSGRFLRGITGDDAQVRRALAALGLRAGDLSMNASEPLYRLELDRLDTPPTLGPAQMRPASQADRPMLCDWYETYLMETGLTNDRDRAREEAAARALTASRGGAERLLIEEGRPVAVASINAQAGDMVQVGGVFVPGPERNRGLGGRVTAARLAEARDAGARVAILFSNNDAASRAYESIGFERIGDYRVSILKRPAPAGAVA